MTGHAPRAAAHDRRARLNRLRAPHPRPTGNRTPPPADAVRAAYRAHVDLEHDGGLGRACPTCRRYLAGIARAAELAATAAAAAPPPPPAATL